MGRSFGRYRIEQSLLIDPQHVKCRYRQVMTLLYLHRLDEAKLLYDSLRDDSSFITSIRRNKKLFQMNGQRK
jgi:hypothetical protein